jgi:histone deacetylase 1/2
MLLGGGGYTIKNVSRCWANETAIALNTKLKEEIDINDKFYNKYYEDNY